MMSVHESSVGYLVRIMQVLLDNDMITVTNLAMLSRTNHKRCGIILARLEQRGFVQVIVNGKKRFIRLTERGSLFARKLVEASELQRSVLYA